jgi:ATP-binding cassette, subfamily B, bacterial
VAVARAWLAGPDLLVLDEATSAVDPALEVQLRRAIERLTAGRTSITVAHRLATAEAADEVLVLHDGHLVERGPHAAAGRGGWGVRRPARRLGAQQRRPQRLTVGAGPGRSRQD